MHDLDRNLPAHLDVPGAIHAAHGSLAKLCLDEVSAFNDLSQHVASFEQSAC